MQAKYLGIAAMAVVSPPMGVAYLARTTLGSREPLADYISGSFIGVILNVFFCVGAEVAAHSIKFPPFETVYSTPEITLRYDAESDVPLGPTSPIEIIAALTTSYGIVAPFFKDRAFSSITELSVTPSPDYSCQWEMNGYVPLERILETQPYLVSNPEILLGNMVKATDPHIVDYARETCRARLETEKQSRIGL